LASLKNGGKVLKDQDYLTEGIPEGVWNRGESSDKGTTSNLSY